MSCVNEAFVCWIWFGEVCLSAVWMCMGDREAFK